MYRIFRPGCLLIGACLLLGTMPLQAADYVIDQQARIGTVGSGTSGLPVSQFDAVQPAVAVTDNSKLALAVWSADDASVIAATDDSVVQFLVDDEFEIYGRVIATDIFEPVVDQFRISTMGDDTESDATERKRYAGVNPAVAWNPISEEFLVVWEGSDDAAPLVAGEHEVFGQRVDIEGKLIGTRFRISTMGDDTTTNGDERRALNAAHPAIAVNAVTGEYLVVWQGDDDEAPLVDDEFEIFGRILDGAAAPTATQFRISFAGNEAQADAVERARYDATLPVAVFNPVVGNYSVAWQADGDENGLQDGEFEIFVQRVDVTGALLGDPVVASKRGAVGDPGCDCTLGDGAFQALAPTLAVDPSSGAQLVAWHGDTAVPPQVDDEFEVHARVYDAAGVAVTELFRVSTMGEDQQTDPVQRTRFETGPPSAAWSSSDQRFLVTWSGDTDLDPLVNNEYEVHARFVDSDGAIPFDQFRVSIHGSDSSTGDARTTYGTEQPAVAYGSGSFLLAWSGDDDLSGSSDGRSQIFSARVAEKFTALQLDYKNTIRAPVSPNPIVLTYVVTNLTDVMAENVTVELSQTLDFPMTVDGCENITTEGICELGDIPGNGTAEFTIVLETDHIRMGDAQGTTVTAIVRSDTTLAQPRLAIRKTFLGATLEIEGGSGSAGLIFLCLMLVSALATTRRQHKE